jgi:3-methylfumaryl-CoA hydratase
MTNGIDIEHLRSWIGREEQVEDTVTPDVARKLCATLDLPDLTATIGEPAPRLIHFCLCHPFVSTAGLALDGHPAKGGFLPPVPLARRMWAGSEIRFNGDLRLGDRVLRRSTIADVELKQGRSGVLCFVTVDHVFDVAGQPVVHDRQTIVFRDALAIYATPPALPAAPPGLSVRTIDPDAALLFRYSALTFNAHRIHYDRSYTTEVEGYAGLVVQGPLQATLLLHSAIHAEDRLPDGFSFRSISPLFDTTPFCVNAGPLRDGVMQLWTASPNGPVAMRAEARWG